MRNATLLMEDVKEVYITMSHASLYSNINEKFSVINEKCQNCTRNNESCFFI